MGDAIKVFISEVRDKMAKVRQSIIIFSIIGLILVWFPILVPVFFTLALAVSGGVFRFDFLMPAELFLFTLIGGIILVWISKISKVYQKRILLSYLGAVLFLVGSQGVAVLLGLASGEREAAGWPLLAVVTIYIGYLLFHITLGVWGILLLRSYKAR